MAWRQPAASVAGNGAAPRPAAVAAGPHRRSAEGARERAPAARLPRRRAKPAKAEGGGGVPRQRPFSDRPPDLLGRRAGAVGGHRRHRRAGLGRHPSAADPVARNSQTAAVGPHPRASTARRSPPAATWAAPRYRCANCRTTCRKAFIAIEDRRFYSHHGVDPWGILAPPSSDVLQRGACAGRLDHHPAARQESVPDPGAHACRASCRSWCWRSGSSTNSARREILELYLNRVYFGSGAYGIEGGGATLLRQIGAAIDARRSGAACRPRAVAVAAGAEPQSGRRRAPRARRPRRHGRRRS